MVTLRETVMIEFKLFIYCEINSYNTIDTKIAIRFLFRIAILISSIKMYLQVFIVFQQFLGLVFLYQINGIGNNIT